MTNMKSQPHNIAAVPVVQERLGNMLASGSHTRKQAGRIRVLMDLFSQTERQNFAAVLDKLFPDVSRIKSQADFRKFKQRFNDYLKEHETALELRATRSPTAPETRHAWFEDLDPASLSASEGAALVEALAARLPALPDNMIDIDLRLRRVPCLVFPGLIDHFGSRFFKDCWAGLSVDERNFYLALGAKFEPIRGISCGPEEPGGVRGFELLALDEAGRSFTSIEKFVQRENYDPFIHFAVMLYAGLLTIHYARTTLPLLDDRIHADNLFFTMNLSPDLPGHPRAMELFEEFKPLLHERFCFEVSEKTIARNVDHVLRLREKFGLRLALDDLDELDPGVRAALEPHVAMTKIGYLKTKPLLARFDKEPAQVIDELRRFKLPDRPLVIEAMDEDIKQEFLVRRWKPEWGALYIQGRDLSLEPLFRSHFTALRDYRISGGGYILSPHVKQTFPRGVFSGVLAGLEVTGRSRNDEALFIELRAPGGEAFTLGAPWKGVNLRRTAADDLPETLERADYIAVPDAAVDSPRLIPLSKLCRFLVDKARAASPDSGRFPREEDPNLPLLSIEHASGRMTVSDGLDLLLRWAGAIRDTEDAAAQEMPATLALLGDTGSGKTLLARRFAAVLHARAAKNPRTPVPVLIDAAALAGRIHGAITTGAPPRIEQLIEWTAEQAGCPAAAAAPVLAAVHAGRALLIIDSLDTVLLRLPHSGSMQYMRTLRETVRPGGRCRLLVTCRTGLFLSRSDEEQRLPGLPAPEEPEAERRPPEGLIIAYLAPFNPDEVRELIRNTCGEADAEGVIATLDCAGALDTLATRPFLCAPLACRASHEPGAALDTGPAFQEWIISLWLSCDSHRHALRTDVKMQLMESLALRLLGEPGRAMHYETLFLWFRGWVRAEYPVETSRELETLDNELRAATLLMRGERGFYRFAHASLLEHCAARAVARALNAGDSRALDAPGLTPEILHAAGRIAARPPFRKQNILHAVEAVLNTDAQGDRQVNALILHNALQ